MILISMFLLYSTLSTTLYTWPKSRKSDNPVAKEAKIQNLLPNPVVPRRSPLAAPLLPNSVQNPKSPAVDPAV